VGVVAAMTLSLVVGAAAPVAAGPLDWSLTANQLYSFTGSGYDRCLDVDSGTANNVRGNVQLYNCRWANDPLNLRAWQRFSTRGIGYNQPSHYVKIANHFNGKCLTYTKQGGPQSPVWSESCDRDGQGWYRYSGYNYTYERSYYLFRAVETANLCLAAVDPWGGNRSGVFLYDCFSFDSRTEWDIR
jgi:hypothetical protein